ncbi:MAG: chain length determinant protein tyrosine kinase EpsG [Hydrogenophaga sp.]|uniref:chain length determinant protein tyrosine kinase EpsG n=1 Tax=unclassified Hydrogenophaga TaxID=2610897 RepID=UPI00257AC263|nr:chain length determinant protein tyrosine kinase EpsG [Hydrogenophaga sp.]MBL0943588.1 chain length determinant protein tyrosine kinase EpsG [Hydrogenophaga sp.]
MNAPERLRSARMGSAIGDILVSRGLLREDDIPRVIAHQREKRLPFGEAAIALRLIQRGDLESALAKQFNYGYLQDASDGLSRELVTAYKPFSNVAEQMRALRGQLMLRWFNGEPLRKVLTVVSHQPRDGRSFLVANLAVAFSQQGQRTLVIDGDLRRPRLHTLFKTEPSAGLAGVLAGRVGTEVIAQVPGLPGLRVLPAGTTPPNPQELVGSPALAELLDAAIAQHDVVLIDTPAGHDCADAEILSARVGAAVLVARRNRTPLRGAGEFARRLQDTGVALVGTVLNDA